MAEATIHGWYRYSDIFFEWHTKVKEYPGNPLKGILRPSALVHPEHPLRKKDAEGLELYIGTLDDGERRLLFSSAQIDYIRRWLFHQGLTDELIPLPHSENLLTRSSLRQIAPEIIREADDLKKIQKAIDKANKRLKGSSALLKSRRTLFEQVRTFWFDRVGTWLALDFEGWELDHNVITEFGWASVRRGSGTDVRTAGHVVLKENRSYRNHQYVPDMQDKYAFGMTEVLPKMVLKQQLLDTFAEAQALGPLFVVCHDYSQDIKYLQQLAIPLTGITDTLPETTPDEGLFVIDTAKVFAALEGEGTRETRSLDRVCRLLGLAPADMHNAGNDAHYTLAALEEMMDGGSLDMQRNRRWPHHADIGQPPPGAPLPGLNVPFKEWEVEEDYSDTEGILGPPAGYDPATGFQRHEPVADADDDGWGDALPAEATGAEAPSPDA